MGSEDVHMYSELFRSFASHPGPTVNLKDLLPPPPDVNVVFLVMESGFCISTLGTATEDLLVLIDECRTVVKEV